MQYYTANTRLPYHIPYPWYLLSMPLSDTARIVYSLILHRIHLSQSNGWMDTEGRVYCVYTIQSLMADTGKSKSTITAALSELDKHGLIYRHRRGLGASNLIYLKVPDIQPSECRKTNPQSSDKPAPNKDKTNKDTNNYLDYSYTGDSL